MFRGMIGYGITEDLQVSFSVPAVFASAPVAPARVTGMMPSTGDFEGVVAWRFHRQGTGVGSRFESTAYGGIILPGPQRPAGMVGEGYRPGPWRKEYPHWDWRFFVEMTGEKAGKVQRRRVEHLLTGGHQIYIGPATLGIYKNYAVEACIQYRQNTSEGDASYG